MKIASLLSRDDFKKIKKIESIEDAEEFDYVLVSNEQAYLNFKSDKVYVGSLLKMDLSKKSQYVHFFPEGEEEASILSSLKERHKTAAELHFLNTGGYAEEIERLEKKTQDLESALNKDREGSTEIKGLREYVVRLLGVNTMEQLVYETESLRILRYKGIKVSLIYTDHKEGFLCTKNMLRKINPNDLKELFQKNKKLSKAHLANILSRPVLSNFQLYKEDLEDEGTVYALFESQKTFEESSYFLDMLKKLLFTNFIRVLQSEKLFKISSLLSQAFSQIQNTSLLIGPDYEIRMSNRVESLGRKCFEYMFQSYEPCKNCPMKQDDETANPIIKDTYNLDEYSYSVHSSRVNELNQKFYLHIYETSEESLKRESIKIQRGKLQSLGLVTQALTHELNNPLTGIKELSQDMSCDFNEQTKADLLEIHKASIRCIKIIENLKKFSSKRIEFERLNLADVVRDSLLLTKMMTRSVRLNLDLEDDLWISGSETLLSQMVFNIIKNSVQAMEDKGHIDIELKEEGEKAVLSFSDSGPGFPEEIQDVSLFGTKNKKEGTGFGLFLVNEFVKLHAGDLDFGNKTEGGAYFKISFALR